MELAAWTSKVVAGATLFLLGTQAPVDSVRIPPGTNARTLARSEHTGGYPL